MQVGIYFVYLFVFTKFHFYGIILLMHLKKGEKMQETITQNTFQTLSEVKSMGYIQPVGENIHLCYKKVSHTLADFLKATPVEPKEALECMDSLVEISKNTRVFFSLFNKTMMDLYDWAASGDTLTQKFAETKLLFFFSCVSPNSVEQKARLLNQIQQMSDWQERKLMVAKVIGQIADHYDQNGQFNEDPGLSILKSTSTILHQICDSSKPKRITNTSAEEKSYFRTCAALIKTRAPQFYEDLWQEQFAPSAPHRYSAPKIEAPVDAYVFNRCGFKNFSRDWDRE